MQSYSKVKILIFSIIAFIVLYFSYMYFFRDTPKRSELILSFASNSWVTLIAGIAGAQTYNYIVTEIRENKKNWIIAKSNFYWPLYSAIMNYFERSTVFRPGELRDVESTPYELKQEIFKIFEDNIKYADNNTLIAYYEFQRYKMYDDNSERGSEQRELELFCKVLEAFYLKSLKYKDIRKHDYFFKSRILFFQIWQLAFNAELIDPDGALTYKFQMDTLRLATFYSIEKLNKMQRKSPDKQKKDI
ncbi:hypothetical protein [Paenibacillus sp. WLX2291]|uniref:hypothetical protein n=1 Tax=Paenibacillus sp. WLX2291 TaxID=3296934 RepID=UPI00398426AA